MNRLTRLAALVALTMTLACGAKDDDTKVDWDQVAALTGVDSANKAWQASESVALPDQCAGSVENRKRAQHLYDSTSTSVHELITCGGLQLALATGIIAAIANSNSQFIPPDMRNEARSLPTSLFQPDGHGAWAMVIPNANKGSFFKVRFNDTNGKLIEHDPFALSSYLVGPQVTRNMTSSQMIDNPETPATFTFKWQSLGPLGHLLNGGQPPANPFKLELSAWDVAELHLLRLSPEKLGPFASLLDLRVSSTTVYSRGADGVGVLYTVQAPANTVASFANSGGMDFGGLDLKATDGVLGVSVPGHTLRYAGTAGLAGKMDLRVERTDGSWAARATGDFGNGAKYEKTSWSCP